MRGSVDYAICMARAVQCWRMSGLNSLETALGGAPRTVDNLKQSR